MPEPPAPPSSQRPDISVHADEAFTAALEKYMVENGPDACVNSDQEDAISADRLIKE